MSKLWIGVDGGGTKTAVFAVDDAGNTVSSHTLGSTNSNSVGEETAIKNLRDGILTVLLDAAAASVKDSDLPLPEEEVTKAHRAAFQRVRGIACGFSGCDTPADAARMKGWVQRYCNEFGVSPKIQVFNDSVAALVSGTGGRLHGVVLICGTGMISYGRNAKGEEHRAAGWGNLVDDGSGYWIGLQGVRAVLHAYDGQGAPTALRDAILKHLELSDEDELLAWLYKDMAWARVAGLAKVVFDVEAAGDPVARGILEAAAAALGRVVKNVITKLKFAEEKGEVPVVLSGSVFCNETLSKLVEAQIKEALSSASIVHLKMEPGLGAALFARSSTPAE